jgi:hypothetical protein
VENFLIVQNHQNVSLHANQSFVLKVSGVHDAVSLSVQSKNGDPVGAGCIILGTGNQGGNGNHAVLCADISARLSSLFIEERGNHARASLHFLDSASAGSFKADLSGNHVSFSVTGKQICPQVIAWGNHTDYHCGN